MVIIYATCHLIGMSSACANPFLYGWFNDNFRTEFICIIITPFQLCCKNNSNAAGRLCSCQSQVIISVPEPSFIALNRSPVVPSATPINTIEHNHQLMTIGMVEGTTSAVVSALTISQPVIRPSNIEEATASVEDQGMAVSSSMTAVTIEEAVVNNLDKQKCYSSPTPSFLKPGYIETHL